jgi:hypothetical protein
MIGLFTTLSTHLPGFLAALPAECQRTFFGLPPWYKYLPMEYDATNRTCALTDSFKLLGNGSDSGLLLIGLAIVEMLLRVAGLVALGYVIYGGFSFMTSQGEPDATAKARHTIINALIGLTIAIIATGLVVFVGTQLSE